MRIAICVATYRRNDGLASALEGIAGQQLPVGLAQGLSVLVVDNNAKGDARTVVETRRAAYPWPLAYVHEPRQGLSRARNAALDNSDGADFIAFLDDDEVPQPDWLLRLAEIQQLYAADVVAGPVLPSFRQAPPAWLAAGRFLEPERHPDGAPLATAYAGNVLFRRALVVRLGLRFDDALGQIGGEDVDFFDRMARAGATLRYCNNAVAHEAVPPERMRLGWLLRRWFRTGNSDGILFMDRHAGRLGRLAVLGRGLIRLGLGSVAVLVTLPFGRRHWMIARLYTVARGLGMICSACRIHYYEYAQ